MQHKILITSCVLVFLFLTGILIRLSYYHATFTGFVPYSAESASHYYYAKRIQSGHGVPRRDKTIQVPEGLYVFQKTSIFMEYVTAWMYNIIFSKLTTWDFHFFTRFSMPFFYMISIFAVFWAAWTLTQSFTASLTACALLVFSKGSIERSSGFEFLSENFSLPFIFLHFALVLSAFQRAHKSSLYFSLSGIALSISLSSWKITQFYLSVFCVFLAVWFLFSSDMRTIQKCALFTSLFCILTGFLTPYLREGKFLITLPCLFLCFLCLAPTLNAYFPRKPHRILLLIAFVSFVAIFYHFFLPPAFRSAMYSHVYGLFVYKIKFLLQKPADAALLPADVRAFWVPPFFSPALKEMLNTFPLLLPVSIAGCAYLLCLNTPLLYQSLRKKTPQGIIFLVFFNLAFLLFYILFTRMRAFLAFFMCLTAVVFLQHAAVSRKRLFAAFCLTLLGAEAYHSLSMNASFFTRALFGTGRALSSQKISMVYENQLMECVRNVTRPDDVLLTRWSLSPTLHAYEGRKIVLHAFFESPDIRWKNQAFNKLLFSSEEALYKQCKAWKATILILAKNMVADSLVSERYMANIKTLNPSMAVVKLLSEKKHSRHFKLIYDNAMFRMFRVIP